MRGRETRGEETVEEMSVMVTVSCPIGSSNFYFSLVAITLCPLNSSGFILVHTTRIPIIFNHIIRVAKICFYHFIKRWGEWVGEVGGKNGKTSEHNNVDRRLWWNRNEYEKESPIERIIWIKDRNEIIDVLTMNIRKAHDLLAR